MDIFEIAKETEFNSKAEAQAVFDYTEMLKKIEESEIDEIKKEEISLVIKEIIADELNHKEKLLKIYSYLTEIEPNKD